MLAIPDTIEEVLLARINRLADEPKRLLQTASVLGREVSLRLLSEIWEGPGGLEPLLRELTRLEFLEQTGAAEPVYAFKHALTQEVAYARLLPAQRRALEALYAERLEEVYDRLAYHYSKAEEAGKAVLYLAGVALKAARGHAHTEAVRALQEGLEHVERLPADERDRQVLELVLRQASSLIPLGRFQEALELLVGQEARLERVRDSSLTGRYHFLLGCTHSYLGDHARTAESAARAFEEAKRGGDEATMGRAYCLLAMEGPLSGQALKGIEHGRQAVALLERTEERWWLGWAHWAVGLNYAQMGEFEPALAAQARAHAIGETIQDPRLQTFVAWATGVVYAAKGEWEAGIEACRRGLERSPDPLNTAIASGWLGYTYLEQEDPARAIPLLQRAVEQLGRFRFGQFQSWFTVFLAEAHRIEGRLDRARDVALQALGVMREARFWYGIGWAERALGRTLHATGALAPAETHFNEALVAFASSQARYDLGRTHLDLAALVRERGKPEGAAAHLQEAQSIFTALRVPRYVERTAELARAFGRPVPAESSR
jgi:tetratricopeptide (TPR) repeat protein